METRNIIDYYHYWKTEAIKADLDSKRHPFSILCLNIHGDFNIGTIIRNANAFLASKVYIYGRKQFDRRGTVGTHAYENLKYVKEIDDLSFIDNYNVVAVDNIGKADPIDDFIWPDNPLMVFGSEQVGIDDEKILRKCSKFVYIKQYGSTRSLNVGCASAITMQDWCKKNA